MMHQVIVITLGVLAGNALWYWPPWRRRRRKSQHVSLKVYGKLTDVEREALKHAIDRLP